MEKAEINLSPSIGQIFQSLVNILNILAIAANIINIHKYSPNSANIFKYIVKVSNFPMDFP